MEAAVKEDVMDNEAAEAAIRACVKRFYEIGGADPMLGPVFEKTIAELEPHLEIVANFWSHALLGTTRYQGTPFGVHVNLPIEVEHFGRWLSLFKKAAAETMPEALATAAIARADHMTQCFQSGLFPFKDAEGRPSKVPA
ncbi:group III truncated hemoglobin [Methylocystis parvus]|uniref:Group III truncated hemoglobin n=1 Tax=Methylocystis parvus TaxID=134 RepID=A0A6B8MDK8_9HYPH|nr:group III truncated hemoglobin [Methylocystis parvus]QGM99383.1 group III truncated hemoglobin [Methylocystis parvus]WBK00225.1 group III truncated hemoglobin [Methylocystis parvus OBBP]